MINAMGISFVKIFGLLFSVARIVSVIKLKWVSSYS